MFRLASFVPKLYRVFSTILRYTQLRGLWQYDGTHLIFVSFLKMVKGFDPIAAIALTPFCLAGGGVRLA